MAEEKKKGKKKRELTPEARQKLSELAKERHARGEWGGKEFGKLGGRPRKDRAAKTVAEAAQEEANRKAIIQVFKDAVDEEQPMGTRLKGAEAWLQVEREETKVSIQESEADAKQMDRDKLLSVLSEKLTQGPAAEILRKQLAGEHIPDAEVVEEEVVGEDGQQ